MTPKERMNYLKSQHRCVRCTKRDARTEAGLVNCQACYEKAKVYQKEKYSKREAEGLCTRCGKPADCGKLCNVCRKDATKRQNEYYRRKSASKYQGGQK